MVDELSLRRSANPKVAQVTIRMARGGFIVAWHVQFTGGPMDPVPMDAIQSQEAICQTLDEVNTVVAELFT